MKYAVLMWGANVTTTTRGIRFQRTSGAGAGTWTANLAVGASTVITDYLPIGNGTNYDLLKSVADALTAADGTDTYTCTLAKDSAGRITGQITITNLAGNTFTLKFSDPLTTIDVSWLGGYQAKLYARAPAYTDKSSTAGVWTAANGQTSSLLWVSPYPAAIHSYEPSPRAVVVGLETISGRSHTRRVAVRGPFAMQSLINQINNKALSGNQSGGDVRFEVDELEAQYVHRQINQENRSLEVWWDHASQGKWFLLFEDEANIGAGTGQNESVLPCRLLDREQAESYDRIVAQTEEAPRLFGVSANLRAIDINHLAAGGA